MASHLDLDMARAWPCINVVAARIPRPPPPPRWLQVWWVIRVLAPNVMHSAHLQVEFQQGAAPRGGGGAGPPDGPGS